MSELRDRIAEALYAHNARELGFDVPDHPWELLPAGAKESWYPRADAILALPGIAVVELPEPERPRVGRYIWMDDLVTVNSGAIDLDYQSISATDARDLAAALLAAADYAERGQ